MSMTNTVRCLFTLNKIEVADGTEEWEDRVFTAHFEPKWDGEGVGQAFYDATPFGELRVGTLNEEAAKVLFPRVGERFFIDIVPEQA